MGILRNIYLYTVSFVALMITITGVITAFNAVSDIIIPESSVYDYGYDYYTTYPEAGIGADDIQVGNHETEEERKEQQLDLEVKRAQKSLLNSLSAIVVGGVLYVFHWKAIEKDHKQNKKDKEAKPENKIV